MIVTREEHAKLHYKLYKKSKNRYDLCAYYLLSYEMEKFRKLFSSLGGKVQGKRNAESGHMAAIQKLADWSKAGKKGAAVCKNKGVNSFFDESLRLKSCSMGGKVQGKRNAESGHLKRIAQLPNKRSSGKRWITDGNQNKMIDGNDKIPKGWKYGMCSKKTI